MEGSHHVAQTIDLIKPVRERDREEAVRRVGGEPGEAAALAIWLFAAGRGAIRTHERRIVVIASDRHAGLPGGATSAAVERIAQQTTELVDGVGSVPALARAARASIVVVDAGRTPLSPTAIRLAELVATGDRPAAADAGIAIATAIANQGVDIAALTTLGCDETDENATARDLGRHPCCAFAVGMCLGFAALGIPILVEGHGAALAAHRARKLSPAAAGYMLGVGHLHPNLLQGSGQPATDRLLPGVGRGDGSAVAMAMTMLDQAVAILAP